MKSFYKSCESLDSGLKGREVKDSLVSVFTCPDCKLTVSLYFFMTHKLR